MSGIAIKTDLDMKIDNAIASHGDGSQGGTDGPFDPSASAETTGN